MADHSSRDERAAVLSDLLARVLASHEDERRAIIHALQEDIGQALAALSLNLRVLEQHNTHPHSADLIGSMRRLTSSTLHELDSLQRSLYPAALESQGVVPAMEVYIQEFAYSTHIQVALDAEVLPRRLAPDVEIALFRIVQDALEHLRAQPCTGQIIVRLRVIKAYVYLVIEHDGADDITGWRTALIAERASALGGQCAITSLPFTGARFEIALPLHDKASA